MENGKTPTSNAVHGAGAEMELAGQCEYEDCREGSRVRSVAPSQGLMFACFATIARTLAFEESGESIYELWYYLCNPL